MIGNNGIIQILSQYLALFVSNAHSNIDFPIDFCVSKICDTHDHKLANEGITLTGSTWEGTGYVCGIYMKAISTL